MSHNVPSMTGNTVQRIKNAGDSEMGHECHILGHTVPKQMNSWERFMRRNPLACIFVQMAVIP